MFYGSGMAVVIAVNRRKKDPQPADGPKKIRLRGLGVDSLVDSVNANKSC